MNKYYVEFSFYDKPQEILTILAPSNMLALTKAVNNVSYEDRNNIVGIKITYSNE